MPTQRLRLLAAALLLTLVACSADDATTTSADAAGAADTAAAPDADDLADARADDDAGADPADVADTSAAPDLHAPDAGGEDDADAPPDEDTTTPPPPVVDCDPLMTEGCALPWPSNRFLVPDNSTATGAHLQFGPLTAPPNIHGERVDPASYTHLDGYGVSTSLLMRWPGIDLTGLPSELSPAGSVAEDAAIVILEMAGPQGEAAQQVVRRIPYFVELDATEPDPEKATMMVRPLVILKEATRYVVAVRGLKRKDGTPFVASSAFEQLRSGSTAGTAQADRQARFDDVFDVLAAAGMPKDSLLLAWDFVTASSATEHGRLLHLRDDAQKVVGALGPEITVTKVTEHTAEEDEHIALEIEATFHVPSYMRVGDKQMHYLNLGPDGMPVQNGWRDPVVYIKVPRTALDGSPHGLLEYGHGLNGHADEVSSGYLGEIAAAQKLILYACHMYGMSQFELDQTLLVVANLDRFPSLPQKLHQGIVEHVLLQRAMRERFAELPEAKSRGLTVDTSRMYYYGNSQGGIYGPTVVALSTDLTRGAVGVSGNNYSLLLQRSSDFETFFSLLRGFYPDTGDQQVLLAMVQLLWDSVDSVTHYAHLGAHPHPGTPPHAVLADIAVGDHQVAPLTQEIAAASGGDLKLMAHWGREVFGVEPQPYPYVGSGVVSWNCGNSFALPGNLPPTEGKDPHECPRRRPEHMQQMAHFFATGEIIDVCGGDGCTPD